MAGLLQRVPPTPKATVLSDAPKADLWAEVRALEMSPSAFDVDESERQELINSRRAKAAKVAERFFTLLFLHLGGDEAAREIFADQLKRPAGHQKDRAADIFLVHLYDTILPTKQVPKHQLAMFIGDLVASIDRYQGTTSGKALARRLRGLLKEREQKMSC